MCVQHPLLLLLKHLKQCETLECRCIHFIILYNNLVIFTNTGPAGLYSDRVHVKTVHPWNLPPGEAIRLQRQLAASLSHTHAGIAEARFIGGVDVSSTKWDRILTAGIIVWDRQDNRIIDSAFTQAESSFPYIPGLLSFREIPVLALAMEKLQSTPEVILVDGQGIAHPRRMGIAAHLGLLVDVPTIGVGKSRLCGTYEEPGPAAGDWSPLTDKGERIGTVLRTKARSNPLFASVGNGCALDEAVTLVQGCLRGYRLPEPTRLAHERVNAVRRGEEVQTREAVQAGLF